MMLRTTELTAKGKGSVANVVNYMKASEYYRDDGGNILPPATWWGGGVDTLGLNAAGRDADSDFAALLDGYNPNGHDLTFSALKSQALALSPLVKNAGQADRRMGHDLTFSALKSQTLALAMASPEERRRIAQRHEEAVEAALRFIASQLHCRTGAGGKGPKAKPTGLVVRRVNHLDSRSGDPQLHTHAVLVNAAQCEDGKWRTYEAKTLLQVEKAAGAIYRHAMARGMAELGYGIDTDRVLDADGRETGEVWHRVAGVDKRAEDHFSKRRAEIEAAMEAEGLSADEAALRTRQAKNEENDPALVIANAREAMAALPYGFTQSESLKGAKGRDHEAKDHDGILAELHKTESAWGVFDLIEVLAKERLDVADPVAEAKQMIARAVIEGTIRPLRDDEDGRPRYCSQAQWDIEQSIISSGLVRMHEEALRLKPATVEEAIAAHEKRQGFSLNTEQRKAVMFVACETGGLACISGKAGTGKTATAGAYIGAFKASGFEVIGTSTSQAATEKLEAEAGIKSFNIASLISRLESGKVTLTAKSVIIVDEAGMVGAQSFRAIQRFADAAGAKVIAVGDALQLQPVEAGSPFRVLTTEIGDAQLSDIRRQKQDQERAWANAFYNGASGASIVDEWKQTGAMAVVEERAQGVSQLVADYMASQRDPRERLILAQTHEDCRAITTALRPQLKAAGVLGESVAITTMESSGKEQQLEVAVGERIRFTKNDQRLGLANNDLATVIGFKKTRQGVALRVRIESDVEGKDGKEVEIPTWHYKRLAHGYAHTVHSAQGQGKDEVFWLARGGRTLDRSMGMVAFTRTKQAFKVYATERDALSMAESMDAWGKKLTAKELAPVEPPAPPLAEVIDRTLADLRAQREQRQNEAKRFERAKAQALPEIVSEVKSEHANALRNVERLERKIEHADTQKKAELGGLDRQLEQARDRRAAAKRQAEELEGRWFKAKERAKAEEALEAAKAEVKRAKQQRQAVEKTEAPERAQHVARLFEAKLRAKALSTPEGQIATVEDRLKQRLTQEGVPLPRAKRKTPRQLLQEAHQRKRERQQVKVKTSVSSRFHSHPNFIPRPELTPPKPFERRLRR